MTREQSFPLIRRHVIGIDTKVPIIGGNTVSYINFDNAASTPTIESVMNKIRQVVPWYSSVHRGSGLKSRMSTAAYDEAHFVVSRFMGADERDYVVIFGKNTTEAINKLARRVPLTADDVVIISSLEHHSNDLPWRAQATVRRVGLTSDGGFDMAHFKRLLTQYGNRVKIVAVSGASNVTGCMPPIYDIARLTHVAGAEIVVDAAQLAPHRAIQMGKLSDPAHLDYVAFSAHKMYAPFGTGVLVGRRDTFMRGAPDYSGGGTVRYVTKHSVDWAESWERDEAGSPNVLGAIALAEAITTLETIGMSRIADHEAMLTAYALRVLKTVPGVTLYGDTDPARTARRTGVITFNIAHVPHALAAAVLSYEYGIGVRNGCFCAHPYVMDLLGVPVRERLHLRHTLGQGQRQKTPGMVRLSFGMYNTVEEIEVLARALKNIAAGSMRHYQCDPQTGEYTPVTDPSPAVH